MRKFMSSTLIDFHFIIAETTHRREIRREQRHESHKFSHANMTFFSPQQQHTHTQLEAWDMTSWQKFVSLLILKSQLT